MREFDALQYYPPGEKRIVSGRSISSRIIAGERGKEFYDGDRANGYGGYADDGRWKAVAEFMVKSYGLKPASKIMQIQCDKGFLVREFERLGMLVDGYESSEYAVTNAVADTEIRGPLSLPSFWSKTHNLVIAIGAVYVLNLPDAIRLLREIERVSMDHSFITLAAYDSEDDLRLLRTWSLLGTTILPKSDWIEVMKYAGYTGDYAFVTARSLNLAWQ